ncbi:MAG: tryptophan synthase subunit alpha [Euryarchaeota archaeon]|nr:tryptophan synthase subunit alpha [Euryarchaeota archaeon]
MTPDPERSAIGTTMPPGLFGRERIQAAFTRAREEKRGVLVAYLMGGDPGPGDDVAYLQALIDGGVDLIEVGIPFSDPMADGPTIQKAATRALAAGTRPKDVLAGVRRLRDAGVAVPIVVMTYANIPYTMTWAGYARALREAGVDGTIIPDLPVDECAPLSAAMADEGLANILLAAPMTTGERLERVAKTSQGFLYLVGSYGTTGARDSLAEETLGLVEAAAPAARRAGIPLAVGFGVSQAEHVRSLIESGADGVVVGSALVRLVEERRGPEEVRDAVARLARGLRPDPTSS